MDDQVERVKKEVEKACKQMGIRLIFEVTDQTTPQALDSDPLLYSLSFNEEKQPLVLFEIGRAAANNEFEMIETDSMTGYSQLAEGSLKGVQALQEAAKLKSSDPLYAQLLFRRFHCPKPYKMIVQDYETKKFELEANVDERQTLLLFVYSLKEVSMAHSSIYYALRKETPVQPKPLRYHFDNVLYLIGRSFSSFKSAISFVSSLFYSSKADVETENSLKESLAQFGQEIQKEGLEIHQEKRKPNLTPEEREKLDLRLDSLVQKMEYMSRQGRLNQRQPVLSLEPGERILQWTARSYSAQSALQPTALVSELFQPLQ